MILSSLRSVAIMITIMIMIMIMIMLLLLLKESGLISVD